MEEMAEVGSDITGAKIDPRQKRTPAATEVPGKVYGQDPAKVVRIGTYDGSSGTLMKNFEHKLPEHGPGHARA
jgi:hypothetical protein